MQETLTFPTLQEQGSPPRFTFPELLHNYTENTNSACCSELSSSTSTPFVSAPSSPTRSCKAFHFSAPTSPSWHQRTLHSQETQGFDFHHGWSPSHDQLSSSSPLYTRQQGPIRRYPSCESTYTWAQPSGHLQSSAVVKRERINSLQAEYHSCSYETEHHGSSHKIADHTRCSARQSFQAEHSRSCSWSQKALHTSAHRERTSSWSPQSSGTEQQKSASVVPQKSFQLPEYERSPNSFKTEHHSRSSSSFSHKPLQTHHERSPSWAQQRSLQRDLQPGHARKSPDSLQIKDVHAANSNLSQHPEPIIADFTNLKALERLQVEDSDASYTRKSLYASAVPFSWEEKPGTPKARSIISEASNGEDDSPSNLLSGSSEFEFSARFSELEDPPMSPTPISSTFSSFKQQYMYGSPSPTHTHTYHVTNHGVQGETVNEEQIWPLRLPPRLDNPVLWKRSIKEEGNELKRSSGSPVSPSTPQSPRSPRIFDIRGALCGLSSPVDATFDPFLVAMEKSMAKNANDLANEELKKSRKKKTNRYLYGHHRRSQSLSPLRVFHWDDNSAKSNSSSNGSISIWDEVKNKHPVHREINARHSVGSTPKELKKWSFKGFFHRKSVSGENSIARHSNMSVSLRSSGRESCSSSGTRVGEARPMEVSYGEDKIKMRGANSPSMVGSIPSTPSSILSPSSSSNSTGKGKPDPNKSSKKGPYALHYGMQKAHTEELRKKTFLPYKQGLLGCLGLSSKSYRALASFSKPLQPVS